jgi:hypothetical protein
VNSPPRKEDGFYTYFFKTDRGHMPISKWNIPTTLGLYPTHTHTKAALGSGHSVLKKHPGSGLG